MRQSQSAVLEMAAPIDSVHATEPFEVAWAGEARWFVQSLHDLPETRISIQVQVSPNGIDWIDHESPALEGAATGMLTITVRDFGHWLRLRTTKACGEVDPLVRIYLVLKA